MMSLLVHHRSPVPGAQFQVRPVPHPQTDSTSLRPVAAPAASWAAPWLVPRHVRADAGPVVSPSCPAEPPGQLMVVEVSTGFGEGKQDVGTLTVVKRIGTLAVNVRPGLL